ncbi:YhbY family RNA-binding protein, partial [Bacillus sp. WP8]|uniref:YhbY family RNA-binding protein n=1 Tax=Bacillus sp. WP8 TaxID=756828 RepID=UPI0011A5CD66
FLRPQAHHLSPIFQLRKPPLNHNILNQISHPLQPTQLLKLTLFQNSHHHKTQLPKPLLKPPKPQLIQTIRNLILLYKESNENKQINLP